jgi:hypothetical protein
MSAICSHTDTIELTGLPDEIAGCEDSSWCYVDDVAFVVTRS